MSRKAFADGPFITRREYELFTSAEWEGVKVQNIEELRNGNMVIPALTTLTISRKRNGFSLVGPKCSCCGVAPHITSVEPRNLLVVPAPEKGGSDAH